LTRTTWLLHGAARFGDDAVGMAHRRSNQLFVVGLPDARCTLRAGCRVFATEDLGRGQLVDEMRIVNPFRVELDTIFAAD
jgi:hypothetical protein